MMKIMHSIIYASLFFLSLSAQAEVIQKIKSKHGFYESTKVVRPDGDTRYQLKLNNKIIFKDALLGCNCWFTGITVGPFEIDGLEIIAYETAFAGNGAPGSNYHFVVIDRNLNLSKPKVYDISGNIVPYADGAISCGTDESFFNLKFDGKKITLDCTERDGRRQTTFKYTINNSEIRVSRSIN